VLYVSDFDTLFQFDLTASNIQASKQIIWYDSDSINIVGQHLLGPGGKIYIANSSTSWLSNVYNLQNMNLSVINSPDSLGAACDFQPYSFYLGGRRSFGGLPNIPDYNLGPVEGSCLTSVNELNGKNEILVYPNPANETLNIIGLDLNNDNKILLFDLTGRKIFESIINLSQINLTNLDPGLYLYQIKNNSSIITSGRITIIN
nr:T9SS type A sorting domain-containing protein [Nitrosopumilus sp.]